jgi:hypothetical protein
MMVKH